MLTFKGFFLSTVGLFWILLVGLSSVSSSEYESIPLIIDEEDDYRGYLDHPPRDVSLWLDENQVRELANVSSQLYAIREGKLLPYLLEPNFQTYLPNIPAEVISINFTWTSGAGKMYQYEFEELKSFNRSILFDPIISINREGFIPNDPSIFRVTILCSGSIPGVSSFAITLAIKDGENNKNLEGTPIRMKLRKHCQGKQSNDINCHTKCHNGGWCNLDSNCECRRGYSGTFCETPLCFPPCLNGGNCIAPGICNCINGYQGQRCEGGICWERCLNGGKCDQKDTCTCSRGYYGPRCEYSKCLIPCLNGGRCIGVDKCRCRKGFTGLQCEISLTGQRDPLTSSRRRKKPVKRKFV
ncbi:protein shifted-like [Panonychus citri]|uniref:protein shifted-like n=1 Tax=Panonychus citri TaxID=50023 RepID=UPI0023081E0F|nr:protein shifted-like [Panonychus citri]